METYRIVSRFKKINEVGQREVARQRWKIIQKDQVNFECYQCGQLSSALQKMCLWQFFTAWK